MTTVAEARFWLNRGVAGLALGTQDAVQIHALRAVLHGYIGERILIGLGKAARPGQGNGDSDAEVLARAQGGNDSRRTDASAASRSEQPDLLLVSLPALHQGVPAMRQALERARAIISARGPVPLFRTDQPEDDDAASHALAAVVLGSGGAVLLDAAHLDLRDANSTDPHSLFVWYRQWTGLHRGNPVMRLGSDTLLDHDAEGALVWVRRPASGSPTTVAICNLTAQPTHLSLVDDLQKLHLRGSFLRTVIRSDHGMGAMPLRTVTLPPFAVYVGDLSR